MITLGFFVVFILSDRFTGVHVEEYYRRNLKNTTTKQHDTLFKCV